MAFKVLRPKQLLLVLLLIQFQYLTASDTLTRAQVYDFSPKDTFDYALTSESWIGTSMSSYNYSYERVVIDSVYYSANQDTLTITKTIFSPVYNYIPYQTTEHITFLQDHEIDHATQNECSDTTYFVDSVSVFNGRRMDGETCSGGLESIYVEHMFTEGLGHTYRYSSGGNPMDGFHKSTRELVYYSKGSERWGNRVVLSNDPDELEADISVYPTLNSGKINLSLKPLLPGSIFQIYDLYGRMLYKQEVSESRTTIHLNNYTPGIYLWQVVLGDQQFRSGRIVIKK